ncbi:hypothetical protein GCM10027053_18660 [Intrasporangium mesophilum]
MKTYRLRKPIALLESFLLPTVMSALTLVVVRPLAFALPVVLVLLAFGAWTLRRVSRRTLTVTEDGMQLQRDNYRLEAPWHAVVGVERGRRRGLVTADELALAESTIVALDHRGNTTTLPQGLVGHPATRRVQVSLYDRDWAASPLGERLKAQGIAI